MPPKKKRGDKPSAAKAAKARVSTAPSDKTAIKKPKKVVAKKRAPKKGVRATAKRTARTSVSGKKRAMRVGTIGTPQERKGVELTAPPEVPIPPKEIVEKAAAAKKISVKIVERRPWPHAAYCNPRPTRRDYLRAAAFVVLVAGLFISGYSMKAIAATFQGPTELPPAGNIPVTIWNRQSSGIKQDTAEIDIDGQMQLGDTDLVLGGDGTERNLIYGVAYYYDYDAPAGSEYKMDSDDYLLKLQTYYHRTNFGPPVTDTSFYSTRFSVNRGGGVYSASNMQANTGFVSGSVSRKLDETNTGQYLYYGAARYDESDPGGLYYSHPKEDYLIWFQTRDLDAPGDPTVDRFKVNVSGDVYATGCFGPIFVGLTAGNYAPGDVSGYYGAHNRCRADYPGYAGVHVCTSQEILESIKCSVDGDPIRLVTDGTAAWVNGGPPGFTANTNDCQGWTSSASNTYGRYWIFNLASGGRGTTTSCNSPGIPFTCCR